MRHATNARLLSLFQYAWLAAEKNGHNDCFTRTLIDHPSFDANALMPQDEYGGELRPLRKTLHEIDFGYDTASEPFALSVLLMLLEKGGDPGLGPDGITPLQVAADFCLDTSDGENEGKEMLWEDVVTLLRDPAAGLNRWKKLNRDTWKFFTGHQIET